MKEEKKVFDDSLEIILEFRLTTKKKSIKQLDISSQPTLIDSILTKLNTLDKSIANDKHLQGDKSNRENLQITSSMLRDKLTETKIILQQTEDKQDKV